MKTFDLTEPPDRETIGAWVLRFCLLSALTERHRGLIWVADPNGIRVLWLPANGSDTDGPILEPSDLEGNVTFLWSLDLLRDGIKDIIGIDAGVRPRNGRFRIVLSSMETVVDVTHETSGGVERLMFLLGAYDAEAIDVRGCIPFAKHRLTSFPYGKDEVAYEPAARAGGVGITRWIRRLWPFKVS